jgi:hypothetical protein
MLQSLYRRPPAVVSAGTTALSCPCLSSIHSRYQLTHIALQTIYQVFAFKLFHVALFKKNKSTIRRTAKVRPGDTAHNFFKCPYMHGPGAWQLNSARAF